MKRISILLAVLALSLVFITSCAEDGVSFEDAKSALFDAEALSKTIVYEPDGENALDADYFEYYFSDGSLSELVEDYVYFTSETTSVCEAGVFKVKDKKAEAALEAMPLYRWKKRMNGAARKRDRTAVGMPNDVLCAEKLCACVNILPISKKAKAEQK